ncbi:hypothetical protein Btru_016898 [Bulinus truncatus]|nr:hypothetical protein Btru_016898 [Bulinus truncatus]
MRAVQKLTDFTENRSLTMNILDMLPPKINNTGDIRESLKPYICTLSGINAMFNKTVPLQDVNDFKIKLNRTIDEMTQMLSYSCPPELLVPFENQTTSALFTVTNEVSRRLNSFFDSCPAIHRRKHRGDKKSCQKNGRNCRRNKKNNSLRNKKSQNKNGTQLAINETLYSYLLENSTNSSVAYDSLTKYLSTFIGFNNSLSNYMKTDSYAKYTALVSPTPNVTVYQTNLRYLISEITADFSVVSKGDIIVGDGSVKPLSTIYAETWLVDSKLKTFLRNRYIACACQSSRKRRGGKMPKMCQGNMGKKGCEQKPKKSGQKKGRKLGKGNNRKVGSKSVN